MAIPLLRETFLAKKHPPYGMPYKCPRFDEHAARERGKRGHRSRFASNVAHLQGVKGEYKECEHCTLGMHSVSDENARTHLMGLLYRVYRRDPHGYVLPALREQAANLSILEVRGWLLELMQRLAPTQEQYEHAERHRKRSHQRPANVQRFRRRSHKRPFTNGHAQTV